MQPKVSIIILNWNGLEDTLECLYSLSKIDYDNFEVILVDNNSSGNDVEIIKEKYGDLITSLIVNDKNLGFSGGNNEGIKAAIQNGADYVMLLNNDTVVEADFLSVLVDKVNYTENIGILTPMIKFFSAKDKIWSAGGSISKIKASGFTFGYNKPAAKYSSDRLCAFASGCCMMIKREVIENVGLLDEDYFLYIEDTDFCHRTIDAQYKILYVGVSRIYHKVFSTTSRDHKLLPLYYSIRNRLYFARKNLGFYFYISFVYIIVAFITKIIFTFNLNPKVGKIILRAYKDFFNKKMGRTDIFDKN